MSGYLEVKSSIYLKTFKTWKRQWCILRPNPTRSGSGSLAVYVNESGTAAGCVDFPRGSSVCRFQSRSRPFAFAVFSPDDLRKPLILLAATSHSEAQNWMDKIKFLLAKEHIYGVNNKDSYTVTLLHTSLAHKCRLGASETSLTITPKGLLLTQSETKANVLIPWRCVLNIVLKADVCAINVDSNFDRGPGQIDCKGDSVVELCTELNLGRPRYCRSESDLSNMKDAVKSDMTSDVSLDDIKLHMSKENEVIPNGHLSRCSRDGHLADDDSMSDRRSLLSIASGIYEEIPDVPTAETERNGSDVVDAPSTKPAEHHMFARCSKFHLEEPTYESVAECIYGTTRRVRKHPPPLPPRAHNGSIKLGESWGSDVSKSNVTRHSSLNSLSRCYTVTSSDYDKNTKTLPSKSKQAFSVFRKRLKSDSRISQTSPKSETKENQDTKKKRFDFTPTRDIFKNFRVSKSLMKNLKITSNLSKIGETKSCEFLDETEHVATNRCSKSVEFLDDSIDFGEDAADLTLESTEDSLSLPHDVLELILCGRDHLTEMRLKQLAEDEYIPMSPIVIPAPPIETEYVVMSPRINIA